MLRALKKNVAGHPALWEAKMVDHLSPGVQDQSEQLGKTLTLQKITRISQAWWQAPVIPATRESRRIA